MATDVLRRSLTEAIGLLEAGAVTSRELAEQVIDAAERWQPHINAFIAIEADELRSAADAADRRRSVNRTIGRLDGIPLAFKDMFDRPGRNASMGSTLLADRIAKKPATAFARLSDQGALWAGPLNMAECVASPSGHNPHFGPVRNPWNVKHTAAGSSGGSGAAVAARIVYGALGSDTGGSIRLPASVNGVVGVKPTYGRVSRSGSAPRAPSLDTVGPLARTARDCALLLDAMAGTDPTDPTTWAAPLEPALPLIDMDLSAIRIGSSGTEPFDSCEADVARAADDACAALAGLCAGRIDRVLPDMNVLYALADTIAKTEAAALHARFMRERADEYSAFVYTRTEVGFHLPPQRYFEALALRARVLGEFSARVFDGIDVLAIPVMPVCVPTLEATDAATPDAINQVLGRMTVFTRPFNYLGLPAVSLPCGFDGQGLPIGLQLIGRPFSEPLLLALAHQYQMVTGWHESRPAPPGQARRTSMSVTFTRSQGA